MIGNLIKQEATTLCSLIFAFIVFKQILIIINKKYDPATFQVIFCNGLLNPPTEHSTHSTVQHKEYSTQSTAQRVQPTEYREQRSEYESYSMDHSGETWRQRRSVSKPISCKQVQNERWIDG